MENKRILKRSVFGYSKKYVERLLSEQEARQNKSARQECIALAAELEKARRALDPLLKENSDLKLLTDKQGERVRDLEQRAYGAERKYSDLSDIYNSEKAQLEQSNKALKAKTSEVEALKMQVIALTKLNEDYKKREQAMSGLIHKLNSEFEHNFSGLMECASLIGDLCKDTKDTFDKTMCDMADTLIPDVNNSPKKSNIA